MKIIRPNKQQVDECYQIVQSLNSDRPSALDKGFMHVHQPREEWSRYEKDSIFYSAIVSDRVLGFVIAVPLGGSDTAHLEGARGTTTWSKEGVLKIPNLYFIEKVAVAEHAMGLGIGRKLYEHLFATHPNNTFFTALVEKPITNTASKNFHLKMGFHRVGTFEDTAFGSLQKYQSGVFLRQI